MIAIRADINESIASGHMMRCLSIADALFSLGEEVLFYTSDECAAQMIINRGFSAICLHNDWRDKESELKQLISELEIARPSLLLVDSYQVTEIYLRELRKIIKLAYLDDRNAFDYPVDIIINYSIYADDIDYSPNRKCLLGMKYVPLRKQFNLSDKKLEQAIHGRCHNKQILITTGASDPYRVATKSIKNIFDDMRLNDYSVTVIKGIYWDDDEESELRNIGGQNAFGNRIRILENVENIADIMLASTMAVSAGGTTLYELCACCVPTVMFSYADNQIGNVNGFADKDIMSYAGDARAISDIGAKITQKLLTYYVNHDIMKNTISKMRSFECRGGAKRLAEAIRQELAYNDR